mgnify:CR=1 FL=1
MKEASKLKLISNFQMGLNELSFTYKNMHIQYVKNGKMIKATDQYGTTLNIKVDYLTFTESFILQSFCEDYKENIVEILLGHLSNLNRCKKDNKSDRKQGKDSNLQRL